MLTVINDLHLGVSRSAGTTPASQQELRAGLLAGFRQLLLQTGHQDLMILGDLFDTERVPEADLYDAFLSLHSWLTVSEGSTLYLVAGNHDLSKSSDKFSSFQLLGRFLTAFWGKRIQVVEQPLMTPYGYIIPHLPNQALFDLELSRVPRCNTLFLHCNYDNNFAVESDQSLNLSADVADTLDCSHILIAHEHQMRKIGTRVLIPGNQLPSSVSDCLRTDAKYYTEVSMGGAPDLIKLADVQDVLLSRQDWKDLQVNSCPFVRVEGHATPDEAASVVERISRYRASSPALVVSNAVEIESQDASEDFAKTLESVKVFDVLAALKEILSADEFAVVETVMSNSS